MAFSNALRNVNGEVEIGRLTLFLASLAAIISPVAFQAWSMWKHDAQFDVVAWCAAYPGGLAMLMTAGVLSIGRKDKNVEDARTTSKAQ